MLQRQRFFVTGTDTDAGKTYVTVGLLKAATRKGYKSTGLKPVAAGAETVNGKLVNSDALLIQTASSQPLPYDQVNPIVFEPAIAPHIAAGIENRLVTVSRLDGLIKGALLAPSDLTLIEGAGGWRVPLNDRELISDLAVQLRFPVILVVNMKLGCINHGLLTAEAILKDGLPLAGWVANSGSKSMTVYDENVMTLKHLMPCPCLGEINWHENESLVEDEFDRVLKNLVKK